MSVTVKSAARWLRRRLTLRRGLLLVAGLAATLALAAMSGSPPPAPLDAAVADGGRVASRTWPPSRPHQPRRLSGWPQDGRPAGDRGRG